MRERIQALGSKDRMPTLASRHTLVILRSPKMFVFQEIHLKELIYKNQTTMYLNPVKNRITEKNSSIDSPSITIEHFPLENRKLSERCITSQYTFLLSYMPSSKYLSGKRKPFNHNG